jgi:hypothetical protein
VKEAVKITMMISSDALNYDNIADCFEEMDFFTPTYMRFRNATELKYKHFKENR